MLIPFILYVTPNLPPPDRSILPALGWRDRLSKLHITAQPEQMIPTVTFGSNYKPPKIGVRAT
ncbi:MAG: hypothetical protein MUF72_23360 [Elainella sp. Prado103]|nr:hypothetical protein [Elainella sp. Prado103]